MSRAAGASAEAWRDAERGRARARGRGAMSRGAGERIDGGWAVHAMSLVEWDKGGHVCLDAGERAGHYA
jgi:hypothetical protein